MIKSGIYIIRCLKSVRVYIGSAFDLKVREDAHFKNLIKNQHGNIKLQRSFNKHGIANFKFDILQYVERKENESKKEFKKRLVLDSEQFYLDTLLFASENDNRFHQLSYNINRKADSPLGYKHTKSAIEDIIAYNKRPDIVKKKSKIGKRIIADRPKEIQDRFVYANKGKKIILSKEAFKIQSDKAKELNQRRKQCPYCKREFDLRNYTKWHGDNCKDNHSRTQESIDKRKRSKKQKQHQSIMIRLAHKDPIKRKRYLKSYNLRKTTTA